MLASKRSRRGRVRNVALTLFAALSLVASPFAATVALSAPPAQAATLQQVFAFGSNPGNLNMYKYIPDGLPTNAPLVVILHGCTQTASLYGPGSGWMKQADAFGFALIVPEQKSANNPQSCFNWFEPGDTGRGSGEALSIKQMVDNVKANHSIASDRVFTSGVSAGGAMSSNMLAAYPDVFAGGGVVAGVPAKCANAAWEAFLCMNPGSNKTPQQWGDLARGVFPSWSGPWPKVSIWHGTSDATVNVMNATESLEQWTNVHGTDQTVDEQETVKGYPRKVYHDTSGNPVVETWVLPGQPHGEPLDPGSAPDQCGTAGSAGMVDMNICASYHMSFFFGLDGDGGPGDPGSATFTSGSEDGYVKAYSDGSSAVVGSAGLGLGIGRGIDGKHNRAVLSFDTSSLPDDAVVTNAYVTVNLNSRSGDPWANPSGNTLKVDAVTGCLGSSCSTGVDDWSATPTASGVGTIGKWTSGSRDSTGFNQAGLDALNLTGTTQLRLGFTQFPTATAYVIIGEENAKLTVEYEQP